ncbi:hypothetical protein [Candidatus Harpocratesius sp.]
MNFEKVNILWIENKTNFIQGFKSPNINSYIFAESGLVFRSSYYQANNLGSSFIFYINSSTHLIQQPIYAHSSEFPGAFCRLKGYQDIDTVWWTNDTLEQFINYYNPKIVKEIFYIELENTYLSSDYKENLDTVNSWILKEILDDNYIKKIDFKNYQDVEKPLSIFDDYWIYIFNICWLTLLLIFIRYKDDENYIFQQDTLSILDKYGNSYSNLRYIKNIQNFINFILILLISISISAITSVLSYIFISNSYFFR